MTNTHALLVLGRKSETVEHEPYRSRSDHDLLVTIATKVECLPDLERRVKLLESARDIDKGRSDALKGLSYIGGGGGVIGVISGVWHFFMHFGGK